VAECRKIAVNDAHATLPSITGSGVGVCNNPE
jgi:hypothetical protein